MSEKHITVFYHEYPKSSDDNSITSYLSNYIRKQIRESKNKSDEEKDILLNWPIVYAHAWRRKSGEIRVYVGETNDLAKRIGQHAIVDQFFFDEADWHKDWLEAIEDGRAFSWFWGSKEMNKSMCLDLEQSLVSLLRQSNVNVKTKAANFKRIICLRIIRWYIFIFGHIRMIYSHMLEKQNILIYETNSI